MLVRRRIDWLIVEFLAFEIRHCGGGDLRVIHRQNFGFCVEVGYWTPKIGICDRADKTGILESCYTSDWSTVNTQQTAEISGLQLWTSLVTTL